MRIALTLLCVFLAGCASHAPAPTSPEAAISLEQMQAEWDRMYAQYAADCIYGSPEHIRANYLTLCPKEREAMAPLGNQIAALRELQAHR